MKQMLTVRDFSRLTGVKESTLRYYDKLGIFSPAIRKENGYRYYTPQQFITINAVRLLYELDMPTREIVPLAKNRTPEHILETLIDKESELESEIQRLKSSYNVITTIRKMVQIGLNSKESWTGIEFREGLGVIMGPENDFGGADNFHTAFMNFCAEAEERGIDLRLPVGGYFPDIEYFYENPGRPKHFFSIDQRGTKKRPTGRYLTSYHRGYYGDTGDIAKRMKSCIEEQGLKPTGPVYNIYLFDEVSVIDPSQYLLQATVKV
jgi:DNA-binding transcriptional MerR regulator/effector-binding domain-containing protein